MRNYILLISVCFCSIDFVYHNYEQATQLMRQLEQDYPNLCKLYSIGKSVQDRELWVLQVTKDVENRKNLLKPRVKWVANMHGDETVGRELTFQMAQYLTQNYETNQTVADFLERIDLHLMPSLNPDGFELSKEGRCQGHRLNANNVDLNRNFPDQFRDPEWTTQRTTKSKLEQETVAMIDWIESSNFVLSLNLHAGSVVASYPFDDAASFARGNRVYSAAPDDLFFKHLARVYSDSHGTMAKIDNKVCNDIEPSFHEGITNGADWYQVPGGMEDYNYLYGDCFEITIELTCCKYPFARELEKEWNLNLESLWNYSLEAYQGVHGFITSNDGIPLERAEISVDGIDKIIHSDKNGAFWRLLLPGKYIFQIRLNEEYHTQTMEV